MTSAGNSSSEFAPSASVATLKQRAKLLQQLRAFFDARGFTEVETPVLSLDTVVDRHLDPIPVGVGGTSFFLQTSPEFGMKRLLAAGMPAIYQVTRAFRAGERGKLHNVEFTIVEWYRVGDDPDAAMKLLSDFALELLPCDGVDRISYRAAFEQHAGIDPFQASDQQLVAKARAAKLAIPQSLTERDRDEWLNLILAECVEPQLGATRPEILFDYPASQAALARVRREPYGEVAERFELYLRGVELANGYHELLDADELRRRQQLANRLRVADGKQRLPEHSRLLTAMQHGLPPASGVALGFDRLVMMSVGATSISEVLAFPIDRA